VVVKRGSAALKCSRCGLETRIIGRIGFNSRKRNSVEKRHLNDHWTVRVQKKSAPFTV